MAGRGAGRHGRGGDCCGAVISLIKDLYLMDCCGYEAKQKGALGLTNNSSNSLKTMWLHIAGRWLTASGGIRRCRKEGG